MRQTFKTVLVLATAVVVSVAGVGAAHASSDDVASGGAAGCCKAFLD